MWKSAHNSRGFSLVEMAFVMVFLGTILTIAVPAFNGFLRSSRVNGVANEVAGAIHFARSLAVSKRQAHHIEFDASEFRVVHTATSDVVRTIELPGGLSCVASADPSFYPWGLADPITITVTGGTRVRNLTLSANGHVAHN